MLVACGVEEKTEVQLLKEMPKPKAMTIDPSLSQKEATEMVHAAQRFYAFWDTGKEELIPQTVTEDFFRSYIAERATTRHGRIKVCGAKLS